MDLEANLKKYLYGDQSSNGRNPDSRYTSFDYCYNYFQSFRESGRLTDIASTENIQISCLHLGFYLASWGMLRGSAELLQKSAHHFTKVIETIASSAPSAWEIDANLYTYSNINLLLTLADDLRRAVGSYSDILVTKILLGVFGNVPAFDTNFRKGFCVSAFGAKALRKIGLFYENNAILLDRYRVPTFDFLTAEPTKRLYTRAKVIDMVFFIEGAR